MGIKNHRLIPPADPHPDLSHGIPVQIDGIPEVWPLMKPWNWRILVPRIDANERHDVPHTCDGLRVLSDGD